MSHIETLTGLVRGAASWVARELNQQVSSSLRVTRMNEPARRGTRQALEAYRTMPWLHGVTKKIGERFAQVEWQLFAQTRGGEAVPLHHSGSIARSIQLSPDYGNRQKMLSRLKQAGELKQIYRHPLLDMLMSGNPMMTGYSARLLTQIYRDIVGESFWALSFNAAGKPDQFWPFPPNWVQQVGSEDAPYKLQIEGRMFEMDERSVVWFREPDPSNPYGRGVGVAMSLGDELETFEYASRFIKTFFLNRGKPEMLVFADGIEKDELRASKLDFERSHQGYQRAHRSWWVNTKLEVKELTQKFTDMELSELRKDERDTILNVFGVPPEQMGIVTSSNRATAHESRAIMAESVITPRLESFREQLQDEIVPLYDPRLILHFVSPVPDDRDFQLDAIRAAPYAATRGEIRKLQGLQDRGPGDDIHLQPLNLIDIQAPEPITIRATKPKQLSISFTSKVLTIDGIPNVLNSLEADRIAVEVEPVWDEELEKWGTDTLRDLGLDTAFNMQNPIVKVHMQSVVGKRIELVDETTRAAIREQLVEGVRAGEGIRELASRVREVFSDADKARSMAIARTETVRSSSFASEAAYMQSGVVWGKRWLVVPDGGRHDSAGYGNTTAALGDDFVFDDGATAPYPGGFGVAGQDINCRCAISPVLDDPEKKLTRQQASVLLQKRIVAREEWVTAAQEAYRRGFANQEKDILKALRKA